MSRSYLNKKKMKNRQMKKKLFGLAYKCVQQGWSLWLQELDDAKQK